MIARLFAALFVVLGLVSASAVAAPLEAYGRLPAVANVVISDDGSTIAYVASREDRQHVVVQTLEGDVLRMIPFAESKVRGLQWAGPDHVLITRSITSRLPGSPFRNEFFQVASLNVRSGNLVHLLRTTTRSRGYLNFVGSDPISGVWQDEHVAFVTAFTSTLSAAEVARVDLDSGEAQAQFEDDNLETGSYWVRADGSVLTRETYRQRTGEWKFWVRIGDEWREVLTLDAPIDTPSVVGLSADGTAVLLSLLDEESGEWRITPVSLADASIGAPFLPRDAVGVVAGRGSRMIGYLSQGTTLTYTFLESEFAANWRRVTASFPAQQVSLVSFTPELDRLVVHVQGDEYAGDYFLYDVAGQSLTRIGREYPDIASGDIASVESITYAAGDGLDIPAYLTLPPGREPLNLPLIVLPHGGPEGRDTYEFNWMAQALASRGYAVLQPNFRGSTGYGSALVAAGHGEWGRKMQTDLSDGVAHLAARGIVDPGRVCIMGASYGGYAALAGVTLQSDIYRCAVSIAGVSDVREMLAREAQVGGARNQTMRYWRRFLAVERHTDASLNEISPRRNAARGRAPVLLLHGRDDLVVEFSQSREMAEALQRAGRDVELIELTAEDHWLSREATRRQMLEAAVAFLERHNPPN